MKRRVGLATAGVFGIVGAALILAPAHASVGKRQSLADFWASLEKSEPEATRALLAMSETPPETTAFLKGMLAPAKLSEDELRDILLSLDSNDESVWKAAFEQLRYLDPRLAMSLPKLMEEPLSPDGRTRLVAVLSDYPPETFAGQAVTLRKTQDDGDYNFVANNASWWAEYKVERLNVGGTRKATWTRAARAIALLEHFATPDAKAILKDLTTGHRDAQPTKLAQEALDRLSLTK